MNGSTPRGPDTGGTPFGGTRTAVPAPGAAAEARAGRVTVPRARATGTPGRTGAARSAPARPGPVPRKAERISAATAVPAPRPRLRRARAGVTALLPLPLLAAGAPAGALPQLAPALALGVLLAFLPEEKTQVTDNPPVPQARSGGAPVPAQVSVRGSVRHGDGAGVPHATLTLIDAGGGQSARGTTAEDGRYALTAPGPGSYTLIAAACGHQPRAVGVLAGDGPVELDVLLGGTGLLAGRVLAADGSGVPGATVTLTDGQGRVTATTRSQDTGGYRFEALVAGRYTLAATAPGRRPAAVPVTVGDDLPTRQNIELAGGAVLTGTVRTEGDRPVPEARVTLLDADGRVLGTALTRPDGHYSFTGLASGEYTVVAAGLPPSARALRVEGDRPAEHDLRLVHEEARPV
ncbi:hypothetical protein GCM10009716_28150 [Streptomyces sodiiphilus]|uniref:Alpha-amylase n=1 Tax=Streptomyces sodiiphilus TaxID=226217 RepID=A0ABP5ALU7_9ACTN